MGANGLPANNTEGQTGTDGQQVDENGNPMYDCTVLETITFEMEKGILTAAYSDRVKGQGNILQDNGLIQGSKVLFNTNKDQSVDLYLDNTGRKFELKPETFFWIIGNLGYTEVVLEYQVYLVNSKDGRAIKAIRDNRIAAESVGINVTSFKLKAFVISAVLAGMAGALFGLNYSSMQATKFNFNTSINILVFVVLGGMGNILGSVISATVLYVLPEAMRGLQDYRMILYAIVLILVMLFTWSPKFKDLVAIAKAKLFGNKMKKEVGSK